MKIENGLMKLNKREAAKEIIKIDFALNGKDTGKATRAMLENRLSKNSFTKAASIGMDIYTKRQQQRLNVLTRK